MQTFLVLLLIAAMIATVAALVRGIVIFLQNAGKDIQGEGPSDASLRSNKMMQRRIQFQALSIAIIVILLLFASAKGS